MKNKVIEVNELFYCEHICDDDEERQFLNDFTVKKKTGHGLVRYLQQHALEDEKNNEMRTYLVRDKSTNEIVGYFSLKAGMVSISQLLPPETK